MTPLLAVFVILGVAAITTSLMLVLRRVAPPGGRFHDTQRAAGIFAMVGTAFAVLLAFVILLAFQSFDRAREASEREATAIGELHEDAAYLAPGPRQRIRGDLVCYGRAVVEDEWDTMRSGSTSQLVERWTTWLEADQRHAIGVTSQTAVADDIFRAGDDRTGARRQRLTESRPFVPGTVWAILILGAATVVLFVCFFADPRESAVTQGLQMAAVTTIVVSGLLLVHYLDTPFSGRAASIVPSGMRSTLEYIDRDAPSLAASLPCDAFGRPRSGSRS